MPSHANRLLAIEHRGNAPRQLAKICGQNPTGGTQTHPVAPGEPGCSGAAEQPTTARAAHAVCGSRAYLSHGTLQICTATQSLLPSRPGAPGRGRGAARRRPSRAGGSADAAAGLADHGATSRARAVKHGCPGTADLVRFPLNFDHRYVPDIGVGLSALMFCSVRRLPSAATRSGSFKAWLSNRGRTP